jgi:hypothetical protein
VVLLIRAALSLFIALLISRFFFQAGGWVKTIGLAAIMFFLAYLFEYTKKRDKGGGHGN